jgi:RimJ/RimL family protein N-acetyltransferase
VRLRPVTLDDGPLYERMRCDPRMMAELGGVLPRASIPAKLASDVAQAAAGASWGLVIVTDEGEDAGHVCLFESLGSHGPMCEIGWMVLPAFQGRGLGREAARTLLARARAERRWRIVHAFTAITNAPSNGICRSLRFTLVDEQDILFEGRMLHCNHWCIDLGADLPW